MTASDPAVAAAERAWALRKTCAFTAESPWARDSLIPAARQTLAPLRELHDLLASSHGDRAEDFSQQGVMHVMQLLAERIYPEEEL